MKNFLICAWIFAAVSLTAGGEDFRVRLRAEVSVQAETLRLSELLPAGAGKQLKAAAERVSLGRSPQAGSVRVFPENQLRQTIAAAFPGATEIDIPQEVVVRRLGWPLPTEAVRRTVARSKLTQKLELSQAQIVLPAGFTTAVADPKLEVTSLVASRDQSDLLARIRCRERTACGSFLVEIVLREPVGGVRSNELTPASEKGSQSDRAPAPGPVLVKPGRIALLVIDGDGFRVTQPVMPLKQARLGELVRVSDPLTHRSLIAEVTGNGVLHPAAATQKEEAK